MTFLQFLLTQYRGKPDAVRADGVSYWPCPVCDSSSFHTLPIRGQHTKERAKCWSADCGFRGDEMDMLREFHPDETWAELFDRRDQLLFQFHDHLRQARAKAKARTGRRKL